MFKRESLNEEIDAFPENFIQFLTRWDSEQFRILADLFVKLIKRVDGSRKIDRNKNYSQLASISKQTFNRFRAFFLFPNAEVVSHLLENPSKIQTYYQNEINDLVAIFKVIANYQSEFRIELFLVRSILTVVNPKGEDISVSIDHVISEIRGYKEKPIATDTNNTSIVTDNTNTEVVGGYNNGNETERIKVHTNGLNEQATLETRTDNRKSEQERVLPFYDFVQFFADTIMQDFILPYFKQHGSRDTRVQESLKKIIIGLVNSVLEERMGRYSYRNTDLSAQKLQRNLQDLMIRLDIDLEINYQTINNHVLIIIRSLGGDPDFDRKSTPIQRIQEAYTKLRTLIFKLINKHYLVVPQHVSVTALSNIKIRYSFPDSSDLKTFLAY